MELGAIETFGHTGASTISALGFESGHHFRKELLEGEYA